MAHGNRLQPDWNLEQRFVHCCQVECILDMVLTVFVAMAAFMGAFLFRRVRSQTANPAACSEWQALTSAMAQPYSGIVYLGICEL